MSFEFIRNFIVAGLIGVLVTHLHSQDCSKPLLVIEKLNLEHVEPKPLNDSLSNKIYSEVFLHIDPFHWFFSQRDLEVLGQYRFLLDEEIKTRSCQFQNKLHVLYLSRMDRTRNRVDSILSSPMKFLEKEYWNPLSRYDNQFAKNEEKLILKIKNDLKQSILSAAQRLSLADSSRKLSPPELQNLLPAAQANTRKKMLETLDELKSKATSTEAMQKLYLMAIAHVFDPHSEYFSTAALEEFKEELSPERMSYGLQIKEDALGQVRIERLVAGGSAWRSNQLHKDDRLIQIILNNKVIDLTDKDESEIEEILQGKEGNQAELTVLKPSGEKVTVSLVKEKIANTENSVSGFVLKGTRSIGYIQLPGFFSDDNEDKNVNGCANEVAKEIIKLNRQKIEGLILDLRYNGGGSMKEAIELAGIFVDAGPMAIFQQKNGQPITLRDVNKGMAYTGPLVVLVNGLSASASELVAGALQDYNRAVIVGSTTFGKATGQQVFPLQPNSKEDFLKITVSRLYRLNQKSLQHIGVKPDIMLPEVGGNLLPTERSYRYVLTNNPVEKKTYYAVGPLFYFEPWREKSKARVSADEKFKLINNVNQLLLNPLPMQENTYIEYINYLNDQLENISKQYPGNLLYKAKLVEELSSLESYQKAPENLINEIQASPYIREAFNIMCDIIQSKK